MRILRTGWLICALAALLGGPGMRTVAQAPVSPPATTVPSDGNSRAHPDWFRGCVQQVAAMQGKPVDIIFIGDSITAGWLGMPTPAWNEVGGTVWPKWYGNRNALDFGVGADRTQDVLWRLDTMDIKQFRPKVAVILIGTNNNKDTAADIAAGVRAVVNKTQLTFPGAKVILISILPNRRANALMMAADTLIKPMADNKTVFYFDLASLMTPVGDNWKGIGKDHLHLTAEGYELWASSMEPLLDKLLGVAPSAVPGMPAPLSASADAPLTAPAQGARLKIACVGDSITAGTGASVRANNYPSVLSRMLGAQFQVQNFGVSGTTLLKHGDRPYWVRPQYAASATFAPDAVVIMLGTNDSKPQNWAHQDEFAADYAALLDYYAALPSHPRLFACLPPPVQKTAYGIAEGPVLTEITLIRQVAAQKGASVIDVHGGIPTGPANFVDGVHPSDAGYVFLASTVYQGLTGAPVILPAGGASFSAETTVTLVPPTQGAAVRYTTDGSEPTSSSTMYTVPFVVKDTTTVKAQAFAGNTPTGLVSTAMFTRSAAPVNPPAAN